MGPITEAMTRLAGEIRAGYAERLAFVKDMKREVATMRQGFRRANDERVREVGALLAGFRRQNKERARTVMAMRHEVAADLAGAHRAWFGPSPAERRAMAAAERRAKAEAERQIHEAAERDRMEKEAAIQHEAAERDRLAALAMAKEEAIRHQAAQKAEEAKVTKPKPTGHAKKK